MTIDIPDSEYVINEYKSYKENMRTTEGLSEAELNFMCIGYLHALRTFGFISDKLLSEFMETINIE